MEHPDASMKSLLSAMAAAVALLGSGSSSVLDASVGGLLGPLPASRERIELARQRQARHAQAMAHGDPSLSPYFRQQTPVGQSGSRHDEMSWYRELIARG